MSTQINITLTPITGIVTSGQGETDESKILSANPVMSELVDALKNYRDDDWSIKPTSLSFSTVMGDDDWYEKLLDFTEKNDVPIITHIFAHGGCAYTSYDGVFVAGKFYDNKDVSYIDMDIDEELYANQETDYSRQVQEGDVFLTKSNNGIDGYMMIQGIEDGKTWFRSYDLTGEAEYMDVLSPRTDLTINDILKENDIVQYEGHLADLDRSKPGFGEVMDQAMKDWASINHPDLYAEEEKSQEEAIESIRDGAQNSERDEELPF